jgi:hypothetical protein
MIAPTLPSVEELHPWLNRLEANPGSVILIPIDQPEEVCNFTRIGWAWFSREEHKKLKQALEAVRLKRGKASSHPIAADSS